MQYLRKNEFKEIILVYDFGSLVLPNRYVKKVNYIEKKSFSSYPLSFDLDYLYLELDLNYLKTHYYENYSFFELLESELLYEVDVVFKSLVVSSLNVPYIPNRKLEKHWIKDNSYILEWRY